MSIDLSTITNVVQVGARFNVTTQDGEVHHLNHDDSQQLARLARLKQKELNAVAGAKREVEK